MNRDGLIGIAALESRTAKDIASVLASARRV